jgi:hypothetical protein
MVSRQCFSSCILFFSLPEKEEQMNKEKEEKRGNHYGGERKHDEQDAEKNQVSRGERDARGSGDGSSVY